MAALYEGYTLCGLIPDQSNSSSGIDGIEEERDSDHVIVTDSNRSVTLYKVSDQKPLGSWTVKQGQTLTCSAVFNSITNEYVVVSDHKVIRIWKEGDLVLDKTFKATVKADIWKVHCAAGGQPVVLFRRGAVRHLEDLLSAPQQPIEDVLAEDEAIRWSTSIVVEAQQFVLFTTELGGENFFYLQRLNPNSLHKYHLEREEPGLLPLSVSASYKDEHISLLCLYPNGFLYRSLISVRGPALDGAAQAPLPLPRSRVMSLPVGEGLLKAASVLFLDDSHIAAVGAHHPSAGADFLCIWNINFQTLQAGKEMGGKIYGQLWSYSNKFFIPHGKRLSVIPFSCHKSSLASALGKLRQTRPEESKCPTFVPSWNNALHEEKAQLSKTGETRKTRSTRKTQPSVSLTAEQVLELIKTAPVEEVQKEVEELLSRQDVQDLQLQLGKLVSILVCRSQADPKFYTHGTFVQLVESKFLCHSVCPDLLPLALERKDYFLCQICLLFFPDIPEALTCSCLKAFICLPDVDAEKMSLEPDSVSFMDALITQEHSQDDLQNGFSPSSRLEDHSNTVDDQQMREGREKSAAIQGPVCPVGSHKAALLNEILQTAYSDTFLLPHLKDLCPQHVLLFLQYLHFLYLRYSQDTLPQAHSLRAPSLQQIMDWICMMLDAHFTVLVMTPEAKGFLLNLHGFVRSQVKLFSELGKIEGSLQELQKMKQKQDVRQYSIEVIEIF
ncbi:nucleolar protein 11-like [Oryzias melastigma]|uniref:Nucleolar protein 11 n=1 Tax=Oryzias melastigma TaxID=30732 RepID=A0A3B3BQP1_ORYME|nr:nucleolar protein 11-like [Oryzias melastigma]